MIPRRFPLLLLALLPSLAACSVYYSAHVRTPLVAPVDTSCLRMTLAANRQIGGGEPRTVQVPSGSATIYGSTGLFTHQWENVTQAIRRDSSLHGGIMFRDSTIVLSVSEIRINRRYQDSDSPLTAAAMSNFLLQLGDACGAMRPVGDRVYFAEVNEHPYRAAIVHGTGGRVRTRLTVEDRQKLMVLTLRAGRFRIHADTLATDSPPGAPRWLEADTLGLPPLRRGQRFDTDCWRGDSLPAGDLVALVRVSYRDYFPKVFDAWVLDRASRRLRRVDIDGIACSTPTSDRSEVVAPRSLRSAALTFTPAPGMARVYAYSSRRGPVNVPFALEGQVIGRMHGRSFLMVDVPPGRYRASLPSRPNEPSLTVDMAADSVYYFDVHNRTWLFTKNTLRFMEPEHARHTIRRAPMTAIFWRGFGR